MEMVIGYVATPFTVTGSDLPPGQAAPCLDWEQSPRSHIKVFQYTFNVVEDCGAPTNTLGWPSGGNVKNNAASGGFSPSFCSSPSSPQASALMNPTGAPGLLLSSA